MVSAETIIRAICSEFMPELDERRQRKLAGVMAKAYGYGGTTLVSNEANMSRNTVRKGIDELENPIDTAQLSSNGVRRTGGGRISAVEKNPEIIDEVDRLLQETTYGEIELEFLADDIVPIEQYSI